MTDPRSNRLDPFGARDTRALKSPYLPHRCLTCYHREDMHDREGLGCRKCTTKCQEFSPKYGYYKQWHAQRQSSK